MGWACEVFGGGFGAVGIKQGWGGACSTQVRGCLHRGPAAVPGNGHPWGQQEPPTQPQVAHPDGVEARRGCRRPPPTATSPIQLDAILLCFPEPSANEGAKLGPGSSPKPPRGPAADRHLLPPRRPRVFIGASSPLQLIRAVGLQLGTQRGPGDFPESWGASFPASCQPPPSLCSQT